MRFVFPLSLFFQGDKVRPLARILIVGCVPSIKVNQCPKIMSAMNAQTKQLVFQTVHLECRE
jgi:hypothetical protein